MPSMEDLHYSVSATTRAPREGEEDGVKLSLLRKEQFLEMIGQGAFLEHAEYVGNYYGTPAGPVDECLNKGMDVVLEIEVQGALIVKQKRPEAKLVFIIPPSFSDLELRAPFPGHRDGGDHCQAAGKSPGRISDGRSI